MTAPNSPYKSKSPRSPLAEMIHSPRFHVPVLGIAVSLNAMLSIIAYSGTTLAIILFNKMILSIYQFKFEALMTLGHMITCVVFSEVFRIAGLITYPSFSMKIIRATVSLSLFFVLNIVVGLLALRVVNVPMFTSLRRVALLLILFLEWYVLGTRPSAGKFWSIMVMLIGAVVAGAGDLTFDIISYAYVMLNNLLTAGYMIAIKKLDKGEVKLNANAKVFYNSLLSIPWLLFIATVNGEFAAISSYEFLWDTGFQIAFLFSCMLAYTVNAATFWCTSSTNALTTSVVGTMKNILTTFLGMFLFGDVQTTVLLVFGLIIGIQGSLWFSYIEVMGTNKNNSTRKGTKGRRNTVKITTIVDSPNKRIKIGKNKEEV